MAAIFLLIWLLAPEHIPAGWKEYWLWLVLLFILMEEGGGTVISRVRRGQKGSP